MKNNNPLVAIKLIVLLCLFQFTRTEAQSFDPITSKKLLPSDIQISCGTDIRLQRLREDPNYKAREDAMNRVISAASSSSSRLMADYTLPVVFHIISESPFSVTDAQIQSALDDLNDAFSKQGAYAASTGADTKIQFCLAKKDPDGGNTTGITRTTSFLTNFDMDIEDRRLKNLVQWDPSRYINIWYTTDIASEIMATFECGVWNRMKAGGYATLPPGGGTTDGIVVTGFGALLAHEMGHYLGLYHTFEGLNCSNFDCATSGDRVCDTPPDRSVNNSASCSSPENSCSTDTLSGFATDVPDMISNFMDYGNASCHNAFTEGQAVRMRAAIATQRAGLLENECDKPCIENSVADFTRSNPYPIPGDVISFTNTSTGASAYEWQIDNTVVSTSINFSHSFSSQGKFKVTLKAYNADAICYSTYTDYIIVGCGVMARFYPDKRLIASKENIQLDSIFFKNRSVNATSYKWLMSNNVGMTEQEISTATDLKYVFLAPGNYTVRLIATNGTCTDTTEKFSFVVQDPTADGEIYINNLYCYQETKIKVSFFVCNNGFAKIPANTPVSFYDDDPRTPAAHKLNSTFFLPVDIPGKCCGFLYTHTLDVGVPGLNKLYVVLNDSGNVIPVVFPNTKLVEKNYFNNIQVRTNFKFKVNATPPLIIAERGDTLQLNATAGPNSTVSIQWTPTENMSCISCFNPKLIATKDTVEKVTAVSQYGCSDSAFVTIKVPPSDDYTITINDIDCAAGNKLHASFTICNSFKRGDIPKNLTISFYDNDPLLVNAHLLGPPFIVIDTVHSLCASFEHFFNGMPPGKIFAVVNDNGTTIPLSLPNYLEITEKNYLNNTSSLNYQPSWINIQPNDTTIFRKTQAQLSINGPVYDAALVKWFPGNGHTLSCENCLSPMVTGYDSSVVKMEASNKYGCIVKGEAKLNVFPADMVVEILETSCISNGFTLVKFKLCMNNGYDSVFKNIPVSFYDNDPSTGNAKLLPPLFLTPEVRAGDCAEFTQIIKSPVTNKLFAAVNDRGKIPFIDKLYPETDFTNNTNSKSISPFVLTVTPSDTSILRSTSLQLEAQVTGEPLGSLRWQPTQYLSCNTCLTPVATPPATMSYMVIAKNERACTDTAYVNIKTITAGDKVSIPNAFSPNRDGRNDVFYILGTNEIQQIKNFQVFDRWGQAIFQASNTAANDPNYGWKGTLAGGKEANSGTYVYVVSVEFKDGHTELFKGTVILVR